MLMRARVATEAKVLTIMDPVNARCNHISKAWFLDGTNLYLEFDAQLNVDFVTSKCPLNTQFIASK